MVASAVKARGAFFTPPEVARFISEWAIRGSGDRILEPSCGEAAFLLAAAQRIRDLGGIPDRWHLMGHEIDPASATLANRVLADANANASIEVGDFFERGPSPIADAVIGNPPYVRYQTFTGLSRARAQHAASSAGVKLDGLASSWAAFVVHASRFVKPSGRLALVLPAELLHVRYAAPVRSFLQNRFARVTLITFERLIFPRVSTEVVLLLAEGEGPSSEIEVVSLVDASELEGLDPHQAARTWVSKSTVSKWSAALLPATALASYDHVLSARSFAPLSAWGRAYLGTVTGNNRYFALTVEDVVARGIPATDLLPISPPGSRHLKGVVFSKDALKEAAKLSQRTYLFYPRTPLAPESSQYIDEGHQAGVDKAYKCRVRSPWWKVPLVEVPDLFLTYMNHDTVRLVSNEAHAHFLNSVHGVRIKAIHRTLGRELLPIAALNTVTMLGAELIGRSYGGGVLKLEPREADLLPMPTADVVASAESDLRAIAPQLSNDLRSGNATAASRRVDDVLLVRHLGLRRDVVRDLRDARDALKDRRFKRAQGSPR